MIRCPDVHISSLDFSIVHARVYIFFIDETLGGEGGLVAMMSILDHMLKGRQTQPTVDAVKLSIENFCGMEYINPVGSSQDYCMSYTVAITMHRFVANS
jgi:hypothetical protein